MVAYHTAGENLDRSDPAITPICRDLPSAAGCKGEYLSVLVDQDSFAVKVGVVLPLRYHASTSLAQRTHEAVEDEGEQEDGYSLAAFFASSLAFFKIASWRFSASFFSRGGSP